MVQARKVSISQRPTVQLRQTFFYSAPHGTAHIAPSNGKTAAFQRQALRKLSKNKLREARGKKIWLSSIVGSKVWSACTGCRQEKLAYLSAKWSERAKLFFIVLPMAWHAFRQATSRRYLCAAGRCANLAKKRHRGHRTKRGLLQAVDEAGREQCGGNRLPRAHFFYEGRPEIALKFYRRILQMGVNSAELYTNLAMCCFYCQQFDLACGCLQQAHSVADQQVQADLWYNTAHFAMAKHFLEKISLTSLF
ncbi:hypothetical protein niasHT_021715 [Heterodera trifolii]|uniref:Tetratricopeptide repeat protein n=1 Tax=Heterodera trifolii TaxID=157864 RepID=A0ABD2KSB9_9BILA